MSDLPTDLPPVPPVVFPSDGTPFAAPGAPDPAPADPAPAPEPAPVAPDPVPAEPAPVVDSVAQPEVVAPPGGQLLTLPSGHKVALRATRSVRSRDRKSLFDGIDFESGKRDPMTLGMTVLGNIQKLMITAWDVRDFDDATGEPVGPVLPIPSETTDDVLGGLSLEDGTALDNATQEIQKVLLPNFSPSPDPTSPTPPSAG